MAIKLTRVAVFSFVLGALVPAAAAEVPAALLEPYLQVQAALASDQFDGVAARAAEIEKAAAVVGSDGEAIVAGAKKLSAAKDIKDARTAFGDLSTAMVAYAEKVGRGADVRVAFCPMVNKPWLTKDKTIRNPYYGAAMLTCGSFK